MKKHNTQWTIKELVDKQQLVEFPEYQREPTVWNLEKKRRLIDSILRGFDIASVYFFKREDAAYDCIDGRQRINAILSYLGENKANPEDNRFRLTMVNEIYDDGDTYATANGKTFEELHSDFQTRIREHAINVVEISEVDNEEELNLLFLRLQLGQILNAGERLHAMTGAMRDYIFNDIGKHDFFTGVRISYRRYAREQVAAQITLNYFSRKENGEFHRSRYLDLQEFFKDRSQLSADDNKSCQEIKERLGKACEHLNDKLSMISNRALAVSLFLFVSELIDQEREGELNEFAQFLVKFLETLKWQVPQGVTMHQAYHHLLDFQTYVTQAAGEKYAIQNRHDYLAKAFQFYKATKSIQGDEQFEAATGQVADDERSKY